MRYFAILLFSFQLYAQEIPLYYGNPVLRDTFKTTFRCADKLPDSLQQYPYILIFSTSKSALSRSDIGALLGYVNDGGGLYVGADNFPMNAEFNQISAVLMNKVSWGDFRSTNAYVDQKSFLRELEQDSLSAGRTISAVPLDASLTVHMWVDDQPLVTSIKIGKGIILFDGGYSRFYDYSNPQISAMWEKIVFFLKNPE